jgi:hypothetical protein
MSDIDKVIHKLFSTRWSYDLSNAPIEKMRSQLYKSLSDQTNGFWSGHTAYNLMIDGGFLIDSKRKYLEESNKAEGKKLTEMGKLFMESYQTGAKVPPFLSQVTSCSDR